MNRKDRYGIGAVAKLTGLSDHTIRVWERRYQAVVAERTSTGRRAYSPADVEKLGLLKVLTDHGIAISQIAGDSTEALRERAAELSQLSAAAVPKVIRTAVLGEFLPAVLHTSRRNLAPLDIAVADSNADRFAADIARHDIDVIVFESPTLDDEAKQRLREYLRRTGASHGVLVYRFGRSRDVDSARDDHIVVLRAPVDADEVTAAVIRAYTTPGAAAPRVEQEQVDRIDADWEFAGAVAPRRFSQQQLVNLASVSTAIDCECPRHLAQLVGDLNAFEIYSADCANRDDEDAALHRYLQRTTARARALIEVALAKVAEAEKLDY